MKACLSYIVSEYLTFIYRMLSHMIRDLDQLVLCKIEAVLEANLKNNVRIVIFASH